MRTTIAFAAAVALALCTVPAQAQTQESCGLKQYASLPLVPVWGGRIGTSIEIDGQVRLMTLSISQPYSHLDESFADDSGYRVQPLRKRVSIVMKNRLVEFYVVVPSLKLGAAGLRDVQMVVPTGGSVDPQGTVGEIGVDVLSRFDVELDVANAKLNLFSHDHCAGKVVYWSNSYAVVPFETDVGGHPNVGMDLDGKPVTVAFDLAPGPALMGMKTADRIFDIGPSTPGMTPVTDSEGGIEYYRYPFKSLSVAGIAIGNPEILLSPRRGDCPGHQQLTAWHSVVRCFGDSDVLLTLAVLKRLHLYIAFNERKLYITPAAARL